MTMAAAAPTTTAAAVAVSEAPEVLAGGGKTATGMALEPPTPPWTVLKPLQVPVVGMLA
jgi:hypothetical protein